MIKMFSSFFFFICDLLIKVLLYSMMKSVDDVLFEVSMDPLHWVNIMKPSIFSIEEDFFFAVVVFRDESWVFSATKVKEKNYLPSYRLLFFFEGKICQSKRQK